MKLRHIDLQVPDVQATARFFARHLGFTVTSSRTSDAIVILEDGDGFVLVLQRRRPEDAFPKDFHVGFTVDDEAAVAAFQSSACADGITVSDIDRGRRGTLVYCHAPGGFLVEVNCRATR